MKEKVDFTEIKEMCDRLGVDCQIIENGMLITQKKDPWDGVEFAECILDSESYTLGKIYKRDLSHKGHVRTFIDDLGRANGLVFYFFNPSTESAYIEQLKKEAFERFGDIKEGDRFDRDFAPLLESRFEITPVKGSIGFIYNKHDDTLVFNGYIIYRGGKWATRVKGRVEVPEHIIELISNWINKDLGFNDYKRIPGNMADGKAKFLASQLEKYLNR